MCLFLRVVWIPWSLFLVVHFATFFFLQSENPVEVFRKKTKIELR